jgi:hypothetical protein
MRTVNGVELPRVLTAPQAARLGLTRAKIRTELRRGNWQRLASGILLTRPDEPSRADWAEAGVAVAGEGSAVTGWDALRAIGLGGRTPPDTPPVVLMPRGLSRQVGQVRLRTTRRPYSWRLLPADCSTMPLTPVVATARAVADAALEFHDTGSARAVVTSAVQRRACSVDELLAELATAPRRDSAALRRAVADAVAGARSAAESYASGRLARAAVPAFELNVPIVRPGEPRYVVDVLWRALRAALEIDSREFHLSERGWQRTLARHNTLTRLGLAVVHYPPSATRARGWPGEVAGWLHARAAELGVPYPRGRGVLPGTPAPFVLGS